MIGRALLKTTAFMYHDDRLGNRPVRRLVIVLTNIHSPKELFMARPFDRRVFRETYDRWIVAGSFNEEPWYYPRYRSRYEDILERFAQLTDPSPLRLLDIGGGQHALLAKKLWNDRATVADVTEDRLDYVREQGVEIVRWDLSREEPPFSEPFDAIIFSEVIEHLPCAGYIALERLRHCLRPGGILICTTPNFYRPRNMAYVMIGKPIFDHFRRPEAGGGGHLIEYDVSRLRWQFDEAGFRDVSIELRQFQHSPTLPVFRLMYWLGQPLFLIPRFRDNMLAVARA
jgi:2-polyprenyl-3-methyl-5-hydroxy-6-metoxy-1,4-benzoquinol methylase